MLKKVWVGCLLLIGYLLYGISVISGDAFTFFYQYQPQPVSIAEKSGIYCVPVIETCRVADCHVFSDGRQLLLITRNGDRIYHEPGSNTFVKNGKSFDYSCPTYLINGVWYAAADILADQIDLAMELSFEGEYISFLQDPDQNVYHQMIAELMDLRQEPAFRVENFEKYLRVKAQYPAKSMASLLRDTNMGVYDTPYTDYVTIPYPNELLVLVNKHHKLPDGFSPNLQYLGRGEYYQNDTDHRLEKGTYAAFQEMTRAMVNRGYKRVIARDAYRSYRAQQAQFDEYAQLYGRNYALKYCASPGFSEHQTGLCVDVTVDGGVFAYTPEFVWMKNNAHLYGFILRYPAGKESITKYAYEPWHFRYVGVDAAKTMYDENLCLEEYVDRYLEKSAYTSCY